MSSSSNQNQNKGKKGEQTFNILPHPAKTNDPSDLSPSHPQYQPRKESRGHMTQSDAPIEAFHARDPYVPSEEIRNNLPQAASREEMHARQAQLNKD
ncbi:hypothetical protein FA13DRAFT_1792947 [Coprinellus micaceus]|uniref:Uncharacterized protein n=1 Tax=Coprinellus micaceus TaxID=71717 RepID=A0A4Y7T675_COPMI|nr:hypothetical protein FA13DRAFT_1792947 [Coprinellus micaceus]